MLLCLIDGVWTFVMTRTVIREVGFNYTLFGLCFSWVTIVFLYFYSHMGQCK